MTSRGDKRVEGHTMQSSLCQMEKKSKYILCLKSMKDKWQIFCMHHMDSYGDYLKFRKFVITVFKEENTKGLSKVHRECGTTCTETITRHNITKCVEEKHQNSTVGEEE